MSKKKNVYFRGLHLFLSLTGEGGCCLSVPTKFFPFSAAFACMLFALGPSLSSVAKWNSCGRVRLSTADLQGIYDCPARAFFMEILFCRSFSMVSFCFCAMTWSSFSSLLFCAWFAAILDWGALLEIKDKERYAVRLFHCTFKQFTDKIFTIVDILHH